MRWTWIGLALIGSHVAAEEADLHSFFTKYYEPVQVQLMSGEGCYSAIGYNPLQEWVGRFWYSYATQECEGRVRDTFLIQDKVGSTNDAKKHALDVFDQCAMIFTYENWDRINETIGPVCKQ
jgi:hypothetical protein